MTQPYSIFIPAAPKDFRKLKYLLDSIGMFLSGYDDIVIVIPDGVEKIPVLEAILRTTLDTSNVEILYDYHVMASDLQQLIKTQCRYRPNWIKQQYMKLFQGVTKNDIYLTVDSDIVFLRPFPVFTDEGKMILRHGWNQNHRPYFEFQERMLNLPREYPETFITDTNLFDKRIIQEMLHVNGYTSGRHFVEESLEIIDENCFPAEPEIYGQYMAKHHLDQCEFHHLNYPGNEPYKARHVPQIDSEAWSDQEIQDVISWATEKDFDMIGIHSWYDEKVKR